MNGSNTDTESDRRAFAMCPMDLAKIQESIGDSFDLLGRENALAEFFESVGLVEMAAWHRRHAEQIESLSVSGSKPTGRSQRDNLDDGYPGGMPSRPQRDNLHARPQSAKSSEYTATLLLKNPSMRKQFASKCFKKFDVDNSKQLELNETTRVVQFICKCTNMSPPGPQAIGKAFDEEDKSRTYGLKIQEFDSFIQRLLTLINRQGNMQCNIDLEDV